MAKVVPNPFGKKGGLKHQAKVREVVEDMLDENLNPVEEFLVPTPEGSKSKRFVDVARLDDNQDLIKLVQVGKTNAKGEPVKREREAIEDIEKATNKTVNFEDYEEKNTK